MASIRSLSPSDLDEVREIAGIYLSELEVEANGRLLAAACSDGEPATIGLGVERDGDLSGFLVGTVPADGETLDDHFNRPTPVTRDGPSMVLQHLYLRPEYIGNGHGSALLSAALRQARKRNVEAVYGEAWIRPDYKDAVELLESYGFERLFGDPDYWAHEAFVANRVPCPTHDEPYSDCPCRGAVYALDLSSRSPA